MYYFLYVLNREKVHAGVKVNVIVTVATRESYVTSVLMDTSRRTRMRPTPHVPCATHHVKTHVGKQDLKVDYKFIEIML